MTEQILPETFKPILEEYNRQLDWLQSLITDPSGERYFRQKTKGERLGDFEKTMEKTRIFLDFLGNPQEEYHSIHVAGTGGKGSVSMMTGAILKAAAFKTGVHTNPYLQVPNEKWLIEGQMVSPSKLSRIIANLRPLYDSFVFSHPTMRPSYVVAQVAFTHKLFGQESLDFGIIETGMGGRYDSSNILTPDISVITNVDFDHVEALGPKLTDIAFHKAGIIKPATPIVSGAWQAKVLEVIREEAERNNAPLFLLGKNFSYKVKKYDQQGITINVHTPYNLYPGMRVGLPGVFQAENAAVAITACDVLARKYGFSLTGKMINEALSHLRFPGRLEKVQDDPVVILDGAHNPQKMKALSETMQRLYPDKKYCLIVGMLATKDADRSIFHLLSQAKRIIATQPHVIGKPSVNARDLADGIKRLEPTMKIDCSDAVQEAVAAALKETEKDGIILITGSLYMLGEAREFWHPKEEILFAAEFG